MTWRGEYDPDEGYVIGGAPPALVAEIEKKVEELVRAASAFCLDGTGYREQDPEGGVAHVPGGFLDHQVVPRHECVYVLQATYL